MEQQQNFFSLTESEDFQGLISAGDARERVSNFQEAMTNFIDLFTNKRLSNARFTVALEEAATTSDFPILLGTMLDQQLLAAYKSLPNDYREYMKIGSQQDFRKSQLVKIWGLEKPLPRVAQHGEYKQDQENEGGIYNQLLKYGKAFGLTWEDIINDRLGAFSDASEQLSKAAYKTEYRNATAIYAGAPANAFGVAVANSIDGGLVNNLLTGNAAIFSSANLQIAISMLRRQVDVNNEPLFFEKIHLVVPPALEAQAWQALSPSALIISGGDSSAGSKGVAVPNTNVLQKYNIVLHVNPYLPIIDTTTGNKSWYLFIDPADAAAIHFNFLRGHENPEVFMKASNVQLVGGGAAGGMNGSFENDTMWWKVRHCMGGVVVDQRAALAAQVAN